MSATKRAATQHRGDIAALKRQVQEQARNPHLSVTLVAMDEDLVEPEDWVMSCGVALTPTFIVRIEGEEIGRIEEEPEVSIEADLVSILYGNAPE